MPVKLVNQFDQCPVCGSTNRFYESLAKEVKDRGLTSPDFTAYFNVAQLVVMDRTKDKSIPIGSELPVGIAFVDICQDCGTIYAVRLQRDTVKKHLAIPNIPMPPPNRNLLRGS